MGCPSYKPPKGGFLDGLSVVLNACPPESRTSEACLAYWEKQEVSGDKVISRTPLEGGGVKIVLKHRMAGGQNMVSVSWLRPMPQVRGALKTTIRLTEGVNDGFLPGLTQIAEGMTTKK
ncbi:MAG: hypothetical protein HYU64_17525, partial [Armatimonadetes bacterium]|nr:hypothetical protein [Armatimonadota bacterium]